MGQNQQKGVKGQQPVKRAVVHGRGGVRTGTMSDALVQPHPHRQSHTQPQAPLSGGKDGQDPTNTTEQPTTHVEHETLAKVPVRQTPVVLRYRDPHELPRLFEHKKEVDVLYRPAYIDPSKATPWATLRMTQSDDNFYAIVNLAPGEHEFRFQVDGHLRVDASQATQKALEGDLVNVMLVNSLLLTTGDDDDVVDDGEGWGNEIPRWDETRKYPPQLPAHLRYTPLNTPPTQIRCVDGELSNASAQLDSEHLPLPLSVTINHVYFQHREDHIVVGMTTRYNNKYTTVAYYKHLPPSSAVAQGGIPVSQGGIPISA